MRLKTKLGLLAGAAIVLAGGGCVISATQDAGWLRTRIVSAVEKKTGRHLTIDQLHVWLLPFPWVEAQGVHLSDPGSDAHDMFSAASVRVRLSVLPLFQHRVVFSNVSISQPQIMLHRDEDGQSNWHFNPQQNTPEEATPAASGGRVNWDIVVANLELTQGDLQWQDELKHRSGELPVEKFEAGALDTDAPSFHLDALKNKGKLSVDGQTGRLFPHPATQMPVQIKAAFSVDGQPAGLAHIDGTLTTGEPEQREYALRFGGSLGQLQAVQAFFPRAGLPHAENISVNGMIGGKAGIPQLQNFHIHTGTFDLRPYKKDVVLEHLTLDAAQSDSPVALDLAGTAEGTSLGLKGTVGTAEQIMTWLHAPAESSMPVSLTLTDSDAGVHFTGELGGQHSAFDIQGQLKHLATGPSQPVFDGLSVNGHVETDETLELTKVHSFANIVRNLTAQLDVSAARVAWAGQSWEALSAHVVNSNGRLVADPIQARGSGVQQSARFVYDVTQEIPAAELSAHPVVLPLQVVDAWMGVQSWLKGEAFVVGTVSARGRDMSALRQTAAGHVGISVVDGKVGSKILSSLTMNKIPMKQEVSVRCFGTHMQLADGVATIDLLGLQSRFLSLHGHGTVNLNTTDLDLHLAPTLMLAGNSAESDVLVSGSSYNPVIKMEPNSSGRYGLTIGKNDGEDDSCPALLSSAREGEAGPEPAPPAKEKGGKVMNMLRGLGLFH